MNKYIFCIITIIVIVLLVDLVFNFSKPLFKVSENFESLEDDNKMMIFSSVNGGNIMKVAIQKYEEDKNNYYILVNDEDDNVVGLDNSANLVIKPKSEDELWTLRQFGDEANDEILDNELENSGLTDDEKTKIKTEKSFMLTKEHNDKQYALYFNNNSLSSLELKLAIEFHSKSKVAALSVEPAPKKELLYNDYTQTYLGPIKSSTDKEKINIKLNIEDEKLRSLFNLNNTQNSNTHETSDDKCDTWISKKAVESLCPGCIDHDY